MNQETFSVKGTKQQAVVNGLTKAGLSRVSFDEPLLENEVACIVDTLSPQDRQRLANGDIAIGLKSKAKFKNEHGTVTSIDFDLVKVEKAGWGFVMNWDPVVIVEETIPGILSELVRTILEWAIKIDIIDAALVSIDSDAFKTSVVDLARLAGKDPYQVYEKCVTAIMQSCIIGMQRLDVFSDKPVEEQTRYGNEEVYN